MKRLYFYVADSKIQYMVYYVRRNIKYIVLAAVLLIAIGAAVISIKSCSAYADIPIDITYYFLCLDDGSGVEAGAVNASMSGGAGYVYSCGGKDYVVLAAYEDEVSAQKVEKRLSGAVILRMNIGSVRAKRKYAVATENYINAIAAGASALYSAINAYDGGTLSHARFLLEISAAEEALSCFLTDCSLEGGEDGRFEKSKAAAENALLLMSSVALSPYPVSDMRYAQVALCAAVLYYA